MVQAYKSEADMDTRVLLGDFTYDIKGPPLQFFVIKVCASRTVAYYGNEYILIPDSARLPSENNRDGGHEQLWC
ncbi:hypothetical protein Y032_0223g2673 [Ancylostoma ceylanicum]|uniref:Uncharacterized protein n=1 Tax=Ancylostoma ceylanicum TaxID=53326 RepID=A0A016SIC5_9BILA|nr:hypothetical protein Y032_0223g2673 [Ancylostoma ceylanicum]